MSAIYFHTQHEGTATIRGWERAYMGLLCQNIAMAAVPRNSDSVRERAEPGIELREQYFHSDLRIAMAYADRPVFSLYGKPLESFSLILNTVLAVGSDPACLLARLHGQCEIHAYVEGPNRAWLASLIWEGLDRRIFRSGLCGDPSDWESVIELLHGRDDQPVVTSYSVTDSFPNPDIAGWEAPEDEDGEPDHDAWYDLPHDRRWETALAGLRADAASRRDLSPDTLRAPFRHSRSLFDVFNEPPAPDTARTEKTEI